MLFSDPGNSSDSFHSGTTSSTATGQTTASVAAAISFAGIVNSQVATPDMSSPSPADTEKTTADASLDNSLGQVEGQETAVTPKPPANRRPRGRPPAPEIVQSTKRKEKLKEVQICVDIFGNGIFEICINYWEWLLRSFLCSSVCRR